MMPYKNNPVNMASAVQYEMTSARATGNLFVGYLAIHQQHQWPLMSCWWTTSDDPPLLCSDGPPAVHHHFANATSGMLEIRHAKHHWAA